MDVDCKIHVYVSKAIILPYTVWSYFCDGKVHGTTAYMYWSYANFLRVPLDLYWAECKFIIFHVFWYSFASCLCIIKVNTYINISYVHSTDELSVTTD